MKFKSLFLFVFLILPFSALSSLRTGKYFDRAIFVIFENTNYSSAIKQPYFKKLADSGALFTNFHAITHPSQGNYVALTSGSTNGVQNDSVYNLNVNHIADLLEQRGLTWKVYVEDYPGRCFSGKSSGTYERKHNPFMSYLNIQTNPTRCANIVSTSEFDRDVKNGTLPNYAFYVPGMKNDGHDTGVAFADKWYQKIFSNYLNDSRFIENTILISTFDESSGDAKNQIYVSIVGPAVKPIVISSSLNLYSLLNLVEDNWNLGSLGKFDATAHPILDIWR
jgi:phospholipase C